MEWNWMNECINEWNGWTNECSMNDIVMTVDHCDE